MNFKYLLSYVDFTIDEISKFYGFEDKNLKMVEKAFKCQLTGNGEVINATLTLNNKEEIEKCFDKMVNVVKAEMELDEIKMQEIINNIINKQEVDNSIKFVTTYNGKIIRPKNSSQSNYYKLLEKNTIVFAMGAAGTGKTYLAVAYGISLLKIKKINKIIVTRPIVEAGENLGFLPGELKEKVDPYLTPIYDAFNDILGKETTEKYMAKGIIEIAPLAYMRGRTLSDAYVILDEAQNTTSTQMKMFLTRLGYNSKMVITGDESQIDLKSSIKSGIVVASNLLKDIDDICMIKFDSKDVVRHPLVSKIIYAYENAENGNKNI